MNQLNIPVVPKAKPPPVQPTNGVAAGPRMSPSGLPTLLPVSRKPCSVEPVHVTVVVVLLSVNTSGPTSVAVMSHGLPTAQFAGGVMLQVSGCACAGAAVSKTVVAAATARPIIA